jgi:hypothetical protein
MKKEVEDTIIVSQNEEMVPVYHSSKQIETTDRFFLESLTSVNYDTYTAIYELLDNSKDAGATRIDVIYDKKTATLIIKDNGSGMSLIQVFNNMDLGCDRTYTNNQVGYFGMGMKTSTLNLLNTENEADLYSAVEILTNNGEENTKIVWKPLTNVRNIDAFALPMTSEIGTTILINNCVNFHPSVLKKNLGVVFYPTLKNRIVKIFVNDDEVIGTDPLYRSSDKTQTNFVETTVKDEVIKIEAVALDFLEDKIPWDEKKGDEEKGESDDKWSFKKYGCFVNYGGRYLEIGGTTCGTKLFDSWYSRCRIEFTIPKSLTRDFNVNFNKTSGIKIDKEKMPDLYNKIGSLLLWGRNKRQEENKQKKMVLSAEQERENDEITRALNKSAVNAGFIAPKTEDDKVKVSFAANPNKKPKDDTKESTNRKAKIIDKKLYDIRFEPFESTGIFWKLSFENNRFVICINTTHIFYRRIYLNLPKESKLGFQLLLASMAQTQYRIDEYGVSSNDEFFWETYWSQVSLDLAKIMNN